MVDRYQPMQPIEHNESGVKRFRANTVVRYLLDNGGIDLNDLARIDFPNEDRDQFAQLIGYSVSAAPIKNDLVNAAETVTENGQDTDRARILFLEAELASIRKAFSGPVSDLFHVHPDNLTG